jgi:hypothetical protein
MKYISIFILFLAPAFCVAQDENLAKKYEQKTVFLYGSQYMLDGERLPTSGLKIILSKYTDSKDEYISARKWTTIGQVLSLASVGMSFYSLSQIRTNTRNSRNFFLASIVTTYVSMPFLKKGKKHLQKSVWLYNKNVLVN